MKQITQLDDQLKEKILHLENECQTICQKLEQAYQDHFRQYNYQIVIELVRLKKRNSAINMDIFADDYESFIEIGIEQYDGEYFPNSYIPIWKCKTEWFQKIGYLTKQNDLEKKLTLIINEMLEDVELG